MAWSHFVGGATDWTSAHISARLSKDRGRTWGSPFVLQENMGEMCTYSPSLIRLQSGLLGFAFFVKNSKNDNRAFWRSSDDDGKTWSNPVAITPDTAYHILNNDRIVQLADGRIIAPISYAPLYVNNKTPIRSFCAFSDDDGRSWRRGSGEIGLPKRGALEPGIVQRKDGSILMFMRTQLGCAYKAISTDAGETWHDVHPLGPVSSEAPTCIKRIPSTGDLLMVWNHVWDPFKSHWGRSPLTAAVSKDDGETWKCFRNIEAEPDHNYAYCSITFREDEVLLTYYRTRIHEMGTDESSGIELKLKIYPVAWFYHSVASWKTPGAAPFERGR
jgi:sialidase-1